MSPNYDENFKNISNLYNYNKTYGKKSFATDFSTVKNEILLSKETNENKNNFKLEYTFKDIFHILLCSHRKSTNRKNVIYENKTLFIFNDYYVCLAL
jgi:hypothetical protein